MDNLQPPQPPSTVPPPPPPGTFPPNQPPYYAPPPPQEEMGTGKVVGLSALACCIPLVGPLISLTIGINERLKRNAMIVIVLSAVMLLLSVPILGMLAAITIPAFRAVEQASGSGDGGIFEEAFNSTYFEVKDKAKEAEVKANTHNIHLSCEMYYVDNGFYPDSIDVLISNGYIDVLPRNPFSESVMQVVSLSDPPETREGNFSYITKSTDGKITGCTMLCYGSVNTTESSYPGGAGPAAVVLALESEMSIE